MIAVITTPQLGNLLQEFGNLKNLPKEKKEKFQPLIKWLDKHSCKLEPTFPGTGDASMNTYFSLHTSKTITQNDLNSLINLPGVDGAYEKPMDDIPG